MIKTVKSFDFFLIVAIILLVTSIVCARSSTPVRSTAANGLDPVIIQEYNRQVKKEVNEKNTNTVMIMKRRADTFRIAGSRLPDCSHACGSCSPCRLVMVHLGCTNSFAQLESCPMAYKCFCINKSYPVP